jgi:hypothetical protein
VVDLEAARVREVVLVSELDQIWVWVAASELD